MVATNMSRILNVESNSYVRSMRHQSVLMIFFQTASFLHAQHILIYHLASEPWLATSRLENFPFVNRQYKFQVFKWVFWLSSSFQNISLSKYRLFRAKGVYIHVKNKTNSLLNRAKLKEKRKKN